MGRKSHFLTPMLAATGEFQLTAEGRSAPLATRLAGAFESASRTRGLLGRSALPPGEALVIAPCNAVHTFRMLFAIDLIYTNREGRVLKLRHAMAPNRISAAWRAFAVVELPAGTLSRTGAQVGDQLLVTPAQCAQTTS